LLFLSQSFEDRDFRKCEISSANLSAPPRSLAVIVFRRVLTCPAESKPNSKITKTKMIGVYAHGFFESPAKNRCREEAEQNTEQRTREGEPE